MNLLIYILAALMLLLFSSMVVFSKRDRLRRPLAQSFLVTALVEAVLIIVRGW